MEIMNRKILLTGGTGLIGLNLVESLIDHGNEITLVTRSEKKLFELFKANNNINIDFLSVIECDLLANDAKNIIVDEISKEIDSIVFSARSLDSVKLDSTGNLTDLQWLDEFKMATVLPYQLSKELIDRRFALQDIVFISSIYGSVVPNQTYIKIIIFESPPNYGAVKASQIQLAKEMAIRFIHNGTRTNCISYGGVEEEPKNISKVDIVKCHHLEEC